jgi:uncharacterized membrane protein YfcA
MLGAMLGAVLGAILGAVLGAVLTAILGAVLGAMLASSVVSSPPRRATRVVKKAAKMYNVYRTARHAFLIRLAVRYASEYGC